MHLVISIRTLDQREVHAIALGTDRQYIENIYTDLYCVNDAFPAYWPYSLSLLECTEGKWELVVEVSKDIPQERTEAVRNQLLQWLATSPAYPIPISGTHDPIPAPPNPQSNSPNGW